MILAQDRFWRGGIPAPCFTRQLADISLGSFDAGNNQAPKRVESIARTRLGGPSDMAGERKRDGTCQARHFSRSKWSN
jgi:hypothetical protein